MAQMRVHQWPMTENRIDANDPAVPVLAPAPRFAAGFRELVLDGPEGRHLPCALWYPAAPDSPRGITYDTLIRDGVTATRLHGAASPDALPAAGDAPPLVLISHGYPGNRFLMSHLGEALAARGFAAAAIDHPGSTYDAKRDFVETLYYRPLDQRAAVDALAASGLHLDAGRLGVIGYSMGGYGALTYGGAGLTERAAARNWDGPAFDLSRHVAGTATHDALHDPRLRAVVAIGPWGRQHDLWSDASLGAMRAPLLLMAGSADDTSDYAAMRRIWDTAGGTAHLLTFHGAWHNAAAPIPAPQEALSPSPHLDFLPAEHYADPLWPNVTMNTIAQNAAAAFLSRHLSGEGGLPDQAWCDRAATDPLRLTLESRAAR